MTSSDIELTARQAAKSVKKNGAQVVERSADGAVTLASEALHRVSHDLQKAASVISQRTQELVKRENMEKAWLETRKFARQHPAQTAFIASGVAILAAGLIFAMTRRHAH
jgi:ElaB/YqjD/DUF883 family membrane-anchored ribosome-binding protein